MRTIGETIKLLREEKKNVQQAIADALNQSRSSISMYESGERIPTDEIKEAICDYFKIDMNYLFGKTNTRNSYKENYQSRDDEANRGYLADKPELLELYNEIRDREDIYVLFDKTKDLEPKDVESALMFVQTIRKQRGMD